MNGSGPESGPGDDDPGAALSLPPKISSGSLAGATGAVESGVGVEVLGLNSGGAVALGKAGPDELEIGVFG